MPEQRITLTIDSDGKISAKTEGFKGEVCLKELEKILENIATINEIKKSDDYFFQQQVVSENKIQRKQL